MKKLLSKTTDNLNKCNYKVCGCAKFVLSYIIKVYKINGVTSKVTYKKLTSTFIQ